MVSIQRNTIRAGRDGIQVHRGSFAMITDNTLQNGRDGIVVPESSAARIGFTSTAAAEPNPNVIDSNGRHGILVSRNSTARIGGNTIANNGTSGAGSGIRGGLCFSGRHRVKPDRPQSRRRRSSPAEFRRQPGHLRDRPFPGRGEFDGRIERRRRSSRAGWRVCGRRTGNGHLHGRSQEPCRPHVHRSNHPMSGSLVG